MGRAADRYRLSRRRRDYYSLRVRCRTARLLFQAGAEIDVGKNVSWDMRLCALAAFALSRTRYAGAVRE